MLNRDVMRLMEKKITEWYGTQYHNLYLCTLYPVLWGSVIPEQPMLVCTLYTTAICTMQSVKMQIGWHF